MTTNRRRRYVVTAVAVVVVVVIAGVLVADRLLRERPVDPATVELPALSGSADAVREYFRGDGAALLDLLAETGNLSATSSFEQCQALAGRLEAIGDPPTILDRALAVPDQGIRDGALQHTVAVSRYLDDCQARRELPSGADQARFSAIVFRRLLQREGVL